MNVTREPFSSSTADSTIDGRRDVPPQKNLRFILGGTFLFAGLAVMLALTLALFAIHVFYQNGVYTFVIENQSDRDIDEFAITWPDESAYRGAGIKPGGKSPPIRRHLGSNEVGFTISFKVDAKEASQDRVLEIPPYTLPLDGAEANIKVLDFIDTPPSAHIELQIKNKTRTHRTRSGKARPSGTREPLCMSDFLPEDQ